MAEDIGSAAATLQARFARFQINESTFAWSVRAFSLVRKVLGVQFHLHDPSGHADTGDIFLFNHFSRFETFIPQYLIHQRTGALSRAIASAEFFGDGDALGRYMSAVGAVPNDAEGLLPFLAVEILHGRKLVVFPEGGMVKDRRVVDEAGGFSAYSRTSGERRKHHTGAAVLALILDAFKSEVIYAERMGERHRLEEWAQGLGFDHVETLLERVRKPTLIVPANITFYPLRVDENVLSRGLRIFSDGLSRRAAEELLIESNLILRETDMDIRFAEPLETAQYWGWLERKLMSRVAHKFTHLENFFGLDQNPEWKHRFLSSRLRDGVLQIRNEYMRRMYCAVTINLCHVASTLLVRMLDEGIAAMPLAQWCVMVYRCVKALQEEAEVHQHFSLADPERYRVLSQGESGPLEQFLSAITSMELIELDDGMLRLQNKLSEEHHFDEIRLENMVLVYANEAAPVSAVEQVVAQELRESGAGEVAGMDRGDRHTGSDAWWLSLARFDDELRLWHLRREQFSNEDYAELNSRETATERAAPFITIPDAPEPGVREAGVVLVHGFLASPAEMRALGEHLYEQGLVVLGARLEGHGTSPWDLHQRSLEEWLASVARAEQIMSGLARRYVTVGFSTGGALALIQSRRPDPRRVGIAAINVPVRFADPRMKLVPWVARANAIVGSVSTSDGLLPFNPNQTTHPEVNYASIPIAGLHELIKVAEQVLETPPGDQTPLLLLQSDADPVVDPQGFGLLREAYQREHMRASYLQSNRHAVVYDDADGCWTALQSFLVELGLREA